MEEQLTKTGWMENEPLLIMSVKGITDSLLLGVGDEEHGGDFGVTVIPIRYATMATWDLSKNISLMPAVLPLGLVGRSIGEDLLSMVNREDLMLCSAIALTKDSPHKLVQEFIKFWDPNSAASTLGAEFGSE